jgi:chaperonin GroES
MIPSRIKPLHNRVLIKRHDPVTQTRGGIIIPDAHTERPVRATVIAVGLRKNTKGDTLPPLVAPGDEVLIGKYAGIEVRDPDSGELLSLVDDLEVMGQYEAVPA